MLYAIDLWDFLIIADQKYLFGSLVSVQKLLKQPVYFATNFFMSTIHQEN